MLLVNCQTKINKKYGKAQHILDRTTDFVFGVCAASVCPKGLKTSGNSKTKKGMLYLQCKWLNSENNMFFRHPSCSTDPGGGSDDILLIKASASPSEASQESRSQPPNAPSLQRRSLPPQRSSPLGKLDCSCTFEQGKKCSSHQIYL